MREAEKDNKKGNVHERMDIEAYVNVERYDCVEIHVSQLAFKDRIVPLNRTRERVRATLLI